MPDNFEEESRPERGEEGEPSFDMDQILGRRKKTEARGK
jgi:hypothetical protein